MLLWVRCIVAVHHLRYWLCDVCSRGTKKLSSCCFSNAMQFSKSEVFFFKKKKKACRIYLFVVKVAVCYPPFPACRSYNP